MVIHEPSTVQTISILRGLREKYESFHGLRIQDSALVSAAVLADRYITDRQLPDKAVDLVDEAASRKRMEIDSTPVDLDKISQNILHLELERTSLIKDEDSSKASRLKEINDEINSLESKSSQIRQNWNNDREELKHLSFLKKRIEKLQMEIARAKRDEEFRRAAELEYSLKEKLNTYQSKQKNSASRIDSIEAFDIERVVSEWTGVPLNKLEGDESKRLIGLEDELNKIVIGQSEAIASVARSIRISRTGLGNPHRPIGTFLFLGPTGVGKTEVAKALSRTLFQNASSFIRLDMSEYFDKYTVSRLVGASPGYIGYEEGGQLTTAVKNNPYSLVLFDEIEKAHADIYNILLQILDEGRLTDSKGSVADFTNTVIVLTSNAGANLVNQSKAPKSVAKEKNSNQKQACSQPSGGIDSLNDYLNEELLRTFKPELLNRIDDIVLFNQLSNKDLEVIVRLQIAELNQRLLQSGRTLAVSDATIKHIATSCKNTEYGARPIKRAIRALLQAPLSEKLLTGEFQDCKTINIDLNNNEEICFLPNQ